MDAVEVIGVECKPFSVGADGFGRVYRIHTVFCKCGVSGRACQFFSVPEKAFVNGIIPKVGDYVSVNFDRYHHVSSCIVIA